MMTDARVMSIDELKAFLSSSDAFTFKASSRAETYAWVERTLHCYRYLSRPRLEKGPIRRYMEKMTGMSAWQLTRLIAQFLEHWLCAYSPLQTPSVSQYVYPGRSASVGRSRHRQ